MEVRGGAGEMRITIIAVGFRAEARERSIRFPDSASGRDLKERVAKISLLRFLSLSLFFFDCRPKSTGAGDNEPTNAPNIYVSSEIN